MTVDTRHALLAAVSGDLSALNALKPLDRSQVEEQAEGLQLVLAARVVARVLADYDAGVTRRDEVQRWAEFIRWGHLPGTSGPRLSNLEVYYEPEAEDAIVEAIGRLDELGDIIDGELRPGEAAELRAALVGSESAAT